MKTHGNRPMGKATESAGSRGSWDGVPMDSPIASLGGNGPYKPTGILCWNTMSRSGIATLSLASGPTGARSACRKRAIGMPEICTCRVRSNTSINWSITVILKVRL